MKHIPLSASTEIDPQFIRGIGLTAERLANARPLYQAVAQVLEEAIANGSLAPGTQLLPERRLAAWLRISRTTVVQAYRELESRGLVRGYVGRGTYVSAAPAADGAPFAWRGKVAATVLRSNETHLRDMMRESANPHLLSAGAGAPALDVFPADAFAASTERVLAREGRTIWGHGPTEGQARLRERIAERRGTSPDRILVLAGAQQGLDLLARCLIDPDDAVITDRPGYLGAIHTFREAGARLHGWDVSRGDLDELEDLLLRYRPKLIYTNPTYQNPTGWTMPLRMRRDFLKLAARYRVPVVEDDTYGELPFAGAPPPTLQSLDDQSIVIHLNTFSKVLAPGLRLGWIQAAEPIIEHLALIKQRADPHTQSLVQFVVADFLETGEFDAHVARLRAEHRRRSHAAAAAIQRYVPPDMLRITSAPMGGLFFWCRLHAALDARVVLEHALAGLVSFVPGDAFYPDRAGAHELRICFASIHPARADDFGRSLTMAVQTAYGRGASRVTLVAKG